MLDPLKLDARTVEDPCPAKPPIPSASLAPAGRGVPTAGLASIGANGNGGACSGGEFVAESTLGGVVVYAIHQALLTGLRTEALRRRGEIDRSTQVRTITVTVWESRKQGVLVSVVLGCAAARLPLAGLAADAAWIGGDGQGVAESVPCLLGWLGPGSTCRTVGGRL